jgi:hypothetical protein
MNPLSDSKTIGTLGALAEIARCGYCELPGLLQPPVETKITPLSRHILGLTRTEILRTFPGVQISEISTENWFTVTSPPTHGVYSMRISRESRLYQEYREIYPRALSPVYDGCLYGIRVYDSAHRLILSSGLGYEHGMRAVLGFENLMPEIRYIFNLYDSV